jgi:hypothetical protein
MKRSKIFLVFFLFFVMICFVAFAGVNFYTDTADAKILYKSNSFKNIIALNHCTFSLAKIISYNDRIVLDGEYNNIINFINLKNIADERILTIIKQLMDTLTEFKLSELEKKHIVKAYEQMTEKSMVEILLSGYNSAQIATSSVQIATSSAMNPIIAGIGFITQASSAYKDYQRTMKIYHEQITNYNFQMEKDAIKSINSLNKIFLDAYWNVMQESDALDEWRITLSQIDALLEAVREEDVTTRHRRLLRLEKECAFIPAYWYYRADAANEALNKNQDDNSYKIDILKCLEQYEEYRGFFRKDELYAAMQMFSFNAANYNTAEVSKKLQSILDQSPRDPSKHLFAALTYIKFELYDKAIAHLQSNIDTKQFVVVSRTLLSDIYSYNHNIDNQRKLLQRIANDTSSSNQEILFHLGKIPDQKLLESMLPEVQKITLKIDRSFYGNNDLRLSLPVRWVLLNNAVTNSKIYAYDKYFTATNLKLTDDGKFIDLLFKDVLNKNKMLKFDTSLPVTIFLDTEYFPLKLLGRIIPIIQESSGTFSSISATVKDVVGVKSDESTKKNNAFAFTLEQICADNACFAINNDKNLTPVEHKSIEK